MLCGTFTTTNLSEILLLHYLYVQNSMKSEEIYGKNERNNHVELIGGICQAIIVINLYKILFYIFLLLHVVE